MNSDDEFIKAMGDVRPLEHEQRVMLKSTSLPTAVLQARRKAAVDVNLTQKTELSDHHVPPVDPNEILSYQRPGVQHGVFRNFRLGKYAVDARLDLHHHTVDQARLAVSGFVRDCLQSDVRCGLITHGKGEGRQQPALLKSCVAHWLPQFNEVLAFHSAQKRHGGSGATYVLIRKSEKKRQDNLEKHQRRSQ